MKNKLAVVLMFLLIFPFAFLADAQPIFNLTPGDVNGVGDCASGDCLDGSSDGGTYVRLYDGNSHYTALTAGDSSANLTFKFPTAYPAGTYFLTSTNAGVLGTTDPSAYVLLESINTAAELETVANLGAYASDILGAANKAAAATVIGVGTGDSPQFTGIELSHASANTLTASSGTLSIEGAALATAASVAAVKVTQALTVDNSGEDSDPATANLTPTAAELVYIKGTCSDDDGCAITMIETSAAHGDVVFFENASAYNFTFAYSDTVLNHPGGTGTTITVPQYASITLAYETDRWVVVGSYGATMFFSSLASLTPVTDDADDFDDAGIFSTTANMYGGTFIANGTGIINLPAVAVGMNFTVITLGNIAVTINPDNNDKILADGVLLDDGDAILNGSTAGDIATCQYYSADGWVCTTNGWTDAS